MGVESEAVEQIVRLSFMGVEMALRVTGPILEKGMGFIAALVTKLFTAEYRKKGAVGLQGLEKRTERSTVFLLKEADIKKFTESAKKYHVMYHVIYEQNNMDGYCSVVVRSEDAMKLSRVIQDNNLDVLEAEFITEIPVTEQEQQAENSARENPGEEEPAMGREDADDFMNSMGFDDEENPKTAPGEKTGSSPSEPLSSSSENSTNDMDSDKTGQASSVFRGGMQFDDEAQPQSPAPEYDGLEFSGDNRTREEQDAADLFTEPDIFGDQTVPEPQNPVQHRQEMPSRSREESEEAKLEREKTRNGKLGGKTIQENLKECKAETAATAAAVKETTKGDRLQ